MPNIINRILCEHSILSTAGVLGNALLMLPTVLMLLTSASFLVGGWVAPWMFPAAVLFSATYILLSGGVKQRWMCALAFIGMVIVSVCVAALTYDHTYDFYHQEIAVAIGGGWNPIHPYHTELELWSNFYLKLIEIIEGCIMSTTGSLDSGKAINFIFVLALLFNAIDFLSKRVTQKKRRAAIIVVMLCNPVLIASVLTSYIDIYLYIFTCLTLMLLVKIWEQPSARLWGWLVAVTLMCAGTKLNIFFYQIVYLICFLGWILWHRRNDLARSWFVAAAVTIMLVPLLFWHPYVTNTIAMGNPAYPLLGAGSADIMSVNTPEIFLNIDNRIVNFFASLVGWTVGDHTLFITHDTRIGGFGYFLLPILIIILWRAIVCRKQWSKGALAMMLMVFLCCFTFKQTWWARYICQLWAIPVIAMICMQTDRKPLWRNAILILSLATAAQALPAIANSVGYTIRTDIYTNIMRGSTVKLDGTPTVYEDYRLHKMGVSYVPLAEGMINPEKTIRIRADRFCVEVNDSTKEQIESVKISMNPLVRKIVFLN